MATSRMNADDAFALLVQASQRENRKLHLIASELVERHNARFNVNGAPRDEAE